MKINNREVNFFYSVGAHCELDDFLVAHQKMIDGVAVSSISETHVRVQEAVILNRAYHAAHPEDKSEPLTVEEILALPNKVLNELVREVARVEIEDSVVTIEAEAKDENEKNVKSTAR